MAGEDNGRPHCARSGDESRIQWVLKRRLDLGLEARFDLKLEDEWARLS